MGSLVEGQAELHSKTLSQKEKKKMTKEGLHLAL
jgi:hypothetical protein